MNCKPGDLALVVVGTQSGAIVEVIKAADPFPDGPAWTGTSRGKLKTKNRFSGIKSESNRFRVRDSWLRPITGLQIEDDVDHEEKV